MPRPISQRELRNERRFVKAADAVALFHGAPAIDGARLRRDLDAAVDQTPTARA